MAKKEPMSLPSHSPECDASDLLRAEEIKQDKKRYAAAMGILSKKKKAINSLKDLQKVAEEKSKEDPKE